MSPELYEDIKSLIDYAVGTCIDIVLFIGLVKLVGYCLRNTYFTSIEKAILKIANKKDT